MNAFKSIDSLRDLDHVCKIAVTGGPGAGKSTAADLFRRELGPEADMVPEAATILYGGGLPRSQNPEAQKAAQLAIYRLQIALEAIQCAEHGPRILLCDRGTLDGAAYWPGPIDEFFRLNQTKYAQELARYDGVIFFESAAVGGHYISSNNPIRNENQQQASNIDGRLKEIWGRHTCFKLVKHEQSFLHKISNGLRAIEDVVQKIVREKGLKSGVSS